MNKTIIISVAAVAVLTFSACGNKSGDDSAKNAITSAVEKTTEAVKDTANKAVDATKDAAAATADKAKEAANSAVDATKEAASKAVDTAKDAAAATADKAKEAANSAVEATKDAADATINKAKEVAEKTTEAAKDTAAKATEAATGGNDKGKAVFAKCVSCHGADGHTKALGKSEIIGGQAVADLEKKISEYKAGTRNVAGMGMLMNGQVKGLSDEDIKAVAEYISTLK